MPDPANDPTDLEEPKFRLATPSDLGEIVDILTEAAAWARSRGVERWWQVPFPAEWVRAGIERREVYVMEVGPDVVGTVTLRREDPRMWGERPPDAGYLHRLAVRRKYAGRGLGSLALEWAAGEVRRWGRPTLRLDCLATNARLVRYYLDHGFREVGRAEGVFPGEDRPSLLLERSVT